MARLVLELPEMIQILVRLNGSVVEAPGTLMLEW
jgi:hypothetical protein